MPLVGRFSQFNIPHVWHGIIDSQEWKAVMGIPLIQVDAFTSRPFAGNPAAVCLLDQPAETDWMQAVAAEMNLSETAFVIPIDGGFGLRWFTPAVEVELCGHATLATAFALWSEHRVPVTEEIRFSTASGWLSAQRRGELIELDFPATPATEASAPAGLESAMGMSADFIGTNRFDKLLVVDSEQTVRNLKPDFAALAAVTQRGVIATAPSADGAHDFVSRFFAPAAGINEDPVTGSAHCCLAPYWSARLGKREMIGYQASARGGTVHVRLEGDRVILGGHAVMVMRGIMTCQTG
jgi:PhzF family phenazine biosynthesis protein